MVDRKEVIIGRFAIASGIHTEFLIPFGCNWESAAIITAQQIDLASSLSRTGIERSGRNCRDATELIPITIIGHTASTISVAQSYQVHLTAINLIAQRLQEWDLLGEDSLNVLITKNAT